MFNLLGYEYKLTRVYPNPKVFIKVKKKLQFYDSNKLFKKLIWGPLLRFTSDPIYRNSTCRESTCVSRFLSMEFWNVSNKTFDFKCPFFKKRSVNLNAPHLKSKEKNGLTCPFFISDNQKMKLFNYCGGGFKLEPVLTIFNVRLS